MKVSINQLINKLQEAKNIIGGDKEVIFWAVNDPDKDFYFDKGFEQDIKNQISFDQENVSFSINSND